LPQNKNGSGTHIGSRSEMVALRFQWLHVVGVEGILSFTGALSEGVRLQPRIARRLATGCPPVGTITLKKGLCGGGKARAEEDCG